jgi:hypothetical protein
MTQKAITKLKIVRLFQYFEVCYICICTYACMYIHIHTYKQAHISACYFIFYKYKHCLYWDRASDLLLALSAMPFTYIYFGHFFLREERFVLIHSFCSWFVMDPLLGALDKTETSWQGGCGRAA